MKLMNILEQGKKAKSREGNIFTTDGAKIYKNGHIVESMTFELLTRTDFEIFEEYKENFEIPLEEKYVTIDVYGSEIKETNTNIAFDKKVLKNFNAFPMQDKKFAKYLNMAQKLERKMMAFAYLNGAEEIKWGGEEKRYSIENSAKRGLYVGVWTTGSTLGKVYFKERRTAEACLELYRGEIEEVLKLKEKFGV